MHSYIVAIFIILGLFLIFTDFKYRILPDIITWPLIVAGIVYDGVLLYDGYFLNGLLGLFGGVFIYLYFRIFLFFIKKEVIGGGDIKLCIAIGLWIGLPAFLIVFLAGTCASLLFAGFRKITNRWISWPLAPGQLKSTDPYPVPLGVFLVVSVACFYILNIKEVVF